MIKKRFLNLVFIVSILFSVQGMITSVQAQENNLPAIAQSITENFIKGNYEAITETFDGNMKAALSAKQLETVWQQLQAACGSYKKSGIPEKKVIQGYDAIEFLVEFERAKLIQRTVFDKQGKVAGLFFLPYRS